MSDLTTSQEGVITVFDTAGELIAIVRKDMTTRKNVIYSVSEMGFEQIAELLEGKILKTL